MDMNKEITDFEKHAQKFFNTDKAFEKKDNQYIYDEVVMMWDCWIHQTKSKQIEIDPIFDIFHIVSNARNIRTLQTNVENAARRSNCLSRIESIVTETLVSDEPESYGEEYEESLLNWGEYPDEYEARFKSLWSEKLHKIEELQSEIESLKEKLAKVESSKAAFDVLNERNRQISQEHYSTDHDDEYQKNELMRASSSYLDHAIGRGWTCLEVYRSEEAPDQWPWDLDFWKPKSPREDLVRAAALIIAEIERMDRKTAQGEGHE